jgi:pyruvate/2-oxoglutarate dehydrogenase complex dihydrolipoamide acyltransferase (E2) component
VRAEQAGVVQQITAEVGQSVAAGAPLARIVVPDHLQARLKIPEASTQDVALGLAATVDTCTGVVTAELDSMRRAPLRDKSIGFIFQAFNLIGDLTVEENVELPLTYRGCRRPSNLDSKNGDAVTKLLEEMHKKGATICMVTHNPTPHARRPESCTCSTAGWRKTAAVRKLRRGRAPAPSGRRRPAGHPRGGAHARPNQWIRRPRGDAAPRLERALATQGGNVGEAARVLGLSRSALYRRLTSLGIRS